MIKLTVFGRTSIAILFGECFWIWFGLQYDDYVWLLFLSITSIVAISVAGIMNIIAWDGSCKTERDELLARHIANILPVIVFILVGLVAYWFAQQMFEYQLPEKPKRKNDEFVDVPWLDTYIWKPEEKSKES